jgi:hypothetical protein
MVAEPSACVRWSDHRRHDFVLLVLAHPVSTASNPHTQAPIHVLGQDGPHAAGSYWNGT